MINRRSDKVSNPHREGFGQWRVMRWVSVLTLSINARRFSTPVSASRRERWNCFL
jgi:hypothetical protein